MDVYTAELVLMWLTAAVMAFCVVLVLLSALAWGGSLAWDWYRGWRAERRRGAAAVRRAMAEQEARDIAEWHRQQDEFLERLLAEIEAERKGEAA